MLLSELVVVRRQVSLLGCRHLARQPEGSGGREETNRVGSLAREVGPEADCVGRLVPGVGPEADCVGRLVPGVGPEADCAGRLAPGVGPEANCAPESGGVYAGQKKSIKSAFYK